MDSIPPFPTGRETDRTQRQTMVTLHQQGWTYAAIATHLGCSRWTVGRWVRAVARGGEAALAPHSRRPHHPHPQTTSAHLQERIAAVQTAHPRWGARLRRRQLLLDGESGVPSEVTIHAWLRRFGCPLVRPRTGKPLGWTTATTTATPMWEVDFKQKGGIAI